MCTKNFCGILFSVLLTSMLLAALFVPWYSEMTMVRPETITVDNKDAVCEQATMYWWKSAVCTVGNNNKTLCGSTFKNVVCIHGDKEAYDWRDSANCVGDCEHRGQVFDVALALTAVGAIASLVSLLGFVLRCCCEKREATSCLLLGIGAIGFLSVLVGVSYFGINLPHAYDDDGVRTCTNPISPLPFTQWSVDDSPCRKFWGTQEVAVPFTSYQFRTVWGPIGWVVAAASLPVSLIVLCLSYNPSRKSGALIQNDAPQSAYTRYM